MANKGNQGEDGPSHLADDDELVVDGDKEKVTGKRAKKKVSRKPPKDKASGKPRRRNQPRGAEDSYQRSGDRGAFVQSYIYEDEKGDPYRRVDRYENGFMQLHYVKGGMTQKDCWKPGAPKKHYPYMLPSLIKQGPEVPIFICEGEKDAETVIDLGLEATTNSEGANQPWNLNKWFKGRKTVYILEDNDAHGRNHSHDVASNLLDIVDEVRIVNFRELGKKGADVTDWVEAGGTKEGLLAKAAAAELFKKKKIVMVDTGHLHRAADETTAALAAAQAPVLRRAGKLVEPIWSKMKAAKNRETKVTALHPLDKSTLHYLLTKHYVTFMKYDGRSKKDVVINPPSELLEMILNLKHGPFPPVFGTISAPTMRSDGTILDKEGYDKDTKLWYQESGAVLPPIADKPTRAAAKAALADLKSLLVEVAFSAVGDRKPINHSVALAGILTAVLRGAFDLAPLFLFRAHAAGTGKSFLVDIIATIITGRWCPVVSFDKTVEETQKRVGALLLEAPPLISIDNLSGDLKGDVIAQMVERPLVKVRILGKSEMPLCEWRGVLFATGNNVNLVGDLTRRGLICDLDAVTEKPEEREFKNDPLEMVLADRGKYIAAALTIARAYRTSGEQVTCKPLGSYGDWAKVVREPLIWLGEADPVESMEQARKDDPKRNAVLSLIKLWRDHLGAMRAYKVREIINIAGEIKPAEVMSIDRPDHEPVRPEFYDLLIEHAGIGRVGFEAIDPRRVGFWLRSIQGQVHAGYRIMAATESSDGNTWKLEQVPGSDDVN